MLTSLMTLSDGGEYYKKKKTSTRSSNSGTFQSEPTISASDDVDITGVSQGWPGRASPFLPKNSIPSPPLRFTKKSRAGLHFPPPHPGFVPQSAHVRRPMKSHGLK